MSEHHNRIVEYAPASRALLSTRTKHLTLIVIAVAIAVILIPKLARRLYRDWIASEIATYVMPPDQLVLDMKSERDYSSVAVGATQSSVPGRFGRVLPSMAGPTVFIGELKDAAGNARLLRVGFIGRYDPGCILLFCVRSIDRATLGETSSQIRIGMVPHRHDASHLKLFSANHDPTNQSHISLRYSLDDEEGIIDGYLNDDGTMTLELRDPPATAP